MLLGIESRLCRRAALGQIQQAEEPVEVLLMGLGDLVAELFELGILTKIGHVAECDRLDLFGMEQVVEEEELPLRELHGASLLSGWVCAVQRLVSPARRRLIPAEVWTEGFNSGPVEGEGAQVHLGRARDGLQVERRFARVLRQPASCIEKRAAGGGLHLLARRPGSP